MKHIVIPTDFTVRSLQVVHAAIARFSDEKLKITLLHMLRQPDVTGMLFPSIRNKARVEHLDMVNVDFKEACEMFKHSYQSKLVSIQVQFALGDTAAFLRNYLDGEGVDYVVYAEDLHLALPSKRSVAMMPLLKRVKHNTVILSAGTKADRHREEMNTLTGNELRVIEENVSYAASK